MNIELSIEQERCLAMVAASLRTDPATIMAEALEQYLAHDAKFREAVQLGLDQIDRGETFSDEDVASEIDALFSNVEIIRIFHAAQDWP